MVQLLQDRLMNEHLSFQITFDPYTLCFYFSNAKDFFNVDLAHL